jgi:hypothetical protein
VNAVWLPVFSRVDETKSTPPWVPTNRFALSLEEIGYGHQQKYFLHAGFGYV